MMLYTVENAADDWVAYLLDSRSEVEEGLRSSSFNFRVFLAIDKRNVFRASNLINLRTSKT